MHISDARSRLMTRGQILRDGVTERQLKTLVARGDIIRIRTGTYVAAPAWQGLYPEDRHLLRVVAADEARRGGDVVFAGVSAGVAHALPLFRIEPENVHVMGPRTDAVARPKAGLAHHRTTLPDEDKVIIDGVPCTSLARTVFDLARVLPREAAIAAVDAALRAVAWDEGTRTYDLGAAEEFRAELLDRLATAKGARGVKQARVIVRFADGRAHLPGESVSRLYLADLGFAPPRLQVPFTGPNGEEWAIDFGLDDAGAWGEFDGKGKYTDPAMLQGRTTAEAVLAEKYREDWIRGRSQRRFGRWGTPHIATARTLGARLATFQIFAP